MLGGLSRRLSARVGRAGSSVLIPTRAFAISTKRKTLNKLLKEASPTSVKEVKVDYGFEKINPDAHENKDPCYVVNPPGGVRYYYLNRNDEGNYLRPDTVDWLHTRLVIANERQGTGDLFGVTIRNSTQDDTTVFSNGVDLADLSQKDTEAREADLKGIYQLCGQMAYMTKPVIMVMDGITSDTAAGLCLNSKLRAATEFTQFSLDQCGRGYFPDGGATHWLPKLDGGLGMYLALTGETLYGRDVVYARLANYYLPKQQWHSFMDCLQETIGHPDSVEYVLQDMCQMWGGSKLFPFTLEQHQAAINRCFQQDSVEAIMTALKKEKEDEASSSNRWAQMILSKLGTKSPLSLKVTHKALTKGATKTVEECLRMEYRLCRQFMRQRDFLEGLNAFNNKSKPIWVNSTVDEVTDRQVDQMFAAIDGDAPELELPYLDFKPGYDPREDRKPTHSEWVDDSVAGAHRNMRTNTPF